MQKLIYVGLVGLLGTLGRYFVTSGAALWLDVPYGTLAVNVLASNLAGLLTVWAGYSLAKLL
ncbi:MAG TPA: hypothetical protein VGV59_16515 [Pyrinomonadaceae bacterium]|nr:hypothetical protein [Pyrinomonadaceae bacterium]